MILTLELPSKGKIKFIPAYLKIKEWDLEDIKNLSKATASALDDVFNDVLSKDIIREGLDPKFTPGLLGEQDRMFILLNVRANVIGSQYEFLYTHSMVNPTTKKETCGEQMTIKKNIVDEVIVKEIPDKYFPHVYVELPSSKDNMRVLMPSYDYVKSSKQLYKDKKGQDIDSLEGDDPDNVLFWASLYFSGVNDKRFQNVMDTLQYLYSLGAPDTAAIMDTVDYFREWGPQAEISGDCPKCKRRYQFPFPFLDSFFFDKTRFHFDIQSAIKTEPTFSRKPE